MGAAGGLEPLDEVSTSATPKSTVSTLRLSAVRTADDRRILTVNFGVALVPPAAPAAAPGAPAAP